MTGRTKHDHRFARTKAPSLRAWHPAGAPPEEQSLPEEATVDCGWGRLIFGHTFASPDRLAACLRAERPDRRDIAIYIREPHVVLSLAPQDLFLDPSHTYRLWFNQYQASRERPRGFSVRPLASEKDAHVVNRILQQRGMVPIDPEFAMASRASRVVRLLVAKRARSGEVIGLVMGVDHREAFGDPENGSSLWCLAVDAQASDPKIGEMLVRRLIERMMARGRAFVDLSVKHDNHQAIALYERLGFQRVPVFCIKTKTSINEPLFTGPAPEDALNPYAEIIVREARRRGIAVEVQDAEEGYFRLSFGGRGIDCRESLSALTNAVAMSRCDDKTVTRRVLARAGLRVPAQIAAGDEAELERFLARHRRVVVKPARGEQGAGISVDLSARADIDRAIEQAARHCKRVLVEEFMSGQDLRIVVIGYKVVAAAVRRPATVRGTGRHTIRQLIEHQSRRRAAATRGESRIPLDGETERCIAATGHTLDDVLAEGESLAVRKTANLHTGGTIHDVTAELHPALAEAAEAAARALDIPVTGLDFLVPDVAGPDYAIIEANERPGLANHEPQPTAERFIDLLFPQTVPRAPARAGENGDEE